MNLKYICSLLSLIMRACSNASCKLKLEMATKKVIRYNKVSVGKSNGFQISFIHQSEYHIFFVEYPINILGTWNNL